MNFTIDRIILHNFKGLTHENLLFNNSNVIVSGANGSGKSTIMTAWLWLMADCDEKLASNPPVFPLNSEEVNPSVEVIVSIDGRVVSLERRIKRTVKKSKIEGTADSVSFSSTYLVNSVEYGLRDFKKKLEEYGITDKFLALSHPDMFLSQKKDEMRKTLFGMAQAKTDFEIASMESNTSDVAKLLKDYTFQEVEGMQKSALRKIAENYGKSGEILNSKIEGLEMSKVDLDFAELELLKNSINEKIEKNQDAQRVYNLMNSELDELRKNDMALQFEYSTVCQKEENEKHEYENQLKQKRREVEEKASDLDRIIRQIKNEVSIYEQAFKHSENEKAEWEKKIVDTKALVMDESKTYCPVCNRKYAESKVASIIANFEQEKANKIASLEELIKGNQSLLAIKRAERAELDSKLEKAIKDRQELEIILNQPLNALHGNMEEPNPYADKKAELEKQILENQNVMAIKKGSMPNISVLRTEETELQGQLRDCEIQLSKSTDNARIDDMIADLREQQKEFEQNKADAERLLYQLSLVQKRKNELLTDEINAHFKLVKWQMFTFLKNGSYAECCVPTVSGKEFGAALNTAMQVRAKLDIIQGLQNYYGESYPVFVDGSESLDDNSMAQIDMPCQMVYLKVADNTKMFVKEI